MRDTSLPLAQLWEWLLGWLPASLSPEDGALVSGDRTDLGPEMDPNGNPPIRTSDGTEPTGPAVSYTPLQVGNFSSPEKTR